MFLKTESILALFCVFLHFDYLDFWATDVQKCHFKLQNPLWPPIVLLAHPFPIFKCRPSKDSPVTTHYSPHLSLITESAAARRGRGMSIRHNYSQICAGKSLIIYWSRRKECNNCVNSNGSNFIERISLRSGPSATEWPWPCPAKHGRRQ